MKDPEILDSINDANDGNGWEVLSEFYDKEELTRFEAMLRDSGIPFDLISPENHLNSAFGQGTSTPFIVKVQTEQLAQAEELLQTIRSTKVETLSVENYSDKELKEIVLNHDEWHENFVLSAKAELEKRNINLSETELEHHQDKKREELESGVTPNLVIFYVMWLLSLVGGPIGMVAGYFYWKGTTKGSGKQRYYIYSPKYRGRGFLMLLTGIVSLFIQWALLFSS